MISPRRTEDRWNGPKKVAGPRRVQQGPGTVKGSFTASPWFRLQESERPFAAYRNSGPVTLSPPYRPDGVGYHMYIRAILEWDLTFCKWGQLILGDHPKPAINDHLKTGQR